MISPKVLNNFLKIEDEDNFDLPEFSIRLIEDNFIVDFEDNFSTPIQNCEYLDLYGEEGEDLYCFFQNHVGHLSTDNSFSLEKAKLVLNLYAKNYENNSRSLEFQEKIIKNKKVSESSSSRKMSSNHSKQSVYDRCSPKVRALIDHLEAGGCINAGGTRLGL